MHRNNTLTPSRIDGDQGEHWHMPQLDGYSVDPEPDSSSQELRIHPQQQGYVNGGGVQSLTPRRYRELALDDEGNCTNNCSCVERACERSCRRSCLSVVKKSYRYTKGFPIPMNPKDSYDDDSDGPDSDRKDGLSHPEALFFRRVLTYISLAIALTVAVSFSKRGMNVHGLASSSAIRRAKQNVTTDNDTAVVAEDAADGVALDEVKEGEGAENNNFDLNSMQSLLAAQGVNVEALQQFLLQQQNGEAAATTGTNQAPMQGQMMQGGQQMMQGQQSMKEGQPMMQGQQTMKEGQPMMQGQQSMKEGQPMMQGQQKMQDQQSWSGVYGNMMPGQQQGVMGSQQQGVMGGMQMGGNMMAQGQQNGMVAQQLMQPPQMMPRVQQNNMVGGQGMMGSQGTMGGPMGDSIGQGNTMGGGGQQMMGSPQGSMMGSPQGSMMGSPQGSMMGNQQPMMQMQQLGGAMQPQQQWQPFVPQAQLMQMVQGPPENHLEVETPQPEN